jgi:hypothetical protein
MNSSVRMPAMDTRFVGWAMLRRVLCVKRSFFRWKLKGRSVGRQEWIVNSFYPMGLPVYHISKTDGTAYLWTSKTGAPPRGITLSLSRGVNNHPGSILLLKGHPWFVWLQFFSSYLML